MSGSKSRPRKVELASAHKNATITLSILHITTKLVRSLQNNLTTVIYSLVYGLYKITTESIKLVLDAEQSGAGSDLIVPTRDVQKVSYSFLFFYTSLLRYSIDSTEIPSSIFQPTFYHKV